MRALSQTSLRHSENGTYHPCFVKSDPPSSPLMLRELELFIPIAWRLTLLAFCYPSKKESNLNVTLHWQCFIMLAAWLIILSFVRYVSPFTIKVRWQHSRQLLLNFTTTYLFSNDWNDVYFLIVYETVLISFCSEQKKNLWIINKICLFFCPTFFPSYLPTPSLKLPLSHYVLRLHCLLIYKLDNTLPSRIWYIEFASCHKVLVEVFSIYSIFTEYSL